MAEEWDSRIEGCWLELGSLGTSKSPKGWNKGALLRNL